MGGLACGFDGASCRHSWVGRSPHPQKSTAGGRTAAGVAVSL